MHLPRPAQPLACRSLQPAAKRVMSRAPSALIRSARSYRSSKVVVAAALTHTSTWGQRQTGGAHVTSTKPRGSQQLTAQGQH